MRRLALSAGLALALLVSWAPPALADFGFEPGATGFSFAPLAEGGTPEQHAGSHPLSLRTEINFELGPEVGGVPTSEGDVKDLELELPPGVIEDPAAVPHCSQALFHTPRGVTPFETSLSGESCPDKTQIGTVEVRSAFGGGTARTFGLFSLDPPPGAPSEIGTNPFGAPIVFVPRVRQADGEYGLTLVSHNIPQLIDIHGLTLNVWGAPWGLIHNSQRGDCLNEAEPTFGWAKCSVGPPKLNPPLAWLTLPTACEGDLPATVRASSWQEPGQSVARTVEAPGMEGCFELSFEPFAAAAPTDPRASSPTGFDFDLKVDTGGFLDPKRRAPSPLREAVVSLPDGMAVNPSVGAGLDGCHPAQYAAETVFSAPGAGCPNASKIGDFTVESPLFEDPLDGGVFLASPFDNPFGSLIAVYLVAKESERGILVKVAGKIDADPGDGRLVAHFDKLPQLPYSHLNIHFREGQRAPLGTPATCGDYASISDLAPWSDESPRRHIVSPFKVTAGINGGPCPSGLPGFAPAATAGTLNSQAGAYSPFYLHLTRQDTEQEITSYSATMPRGLAAKIAGVPYCSEAAIEAAKHNSGFAETAHPSCPVASQIGRTVAGYGLGQVLSFAPGKLYLAGPFGGQALSIIAVDAATVGPFDLGTIVIRSAIHVDPQSARVSIDSAASDPIPHIIDGIPTHLRDVRVYVDRPNFTLNPTRCAPVSVTSALNGSGQRFSDRSDDTLAMADSFFQAFNCGALGFKPRIALKLKGGTKRGDYPALRAVVSPRAGDANFSAATVTLPPSEFLAQRHIGQVCTRAQFGRHECPARSIYGHARVFTPLLDQPLEGPVYLRSSDNTLPDVVVALSGGGIGISVDVVGQIDSVGGGIRGRFDGLPDAPASKFVFSLRGAKRGLLVNSEDLCAETQYARARLIGQNNRGLRMGVPLRADCRKHGRKHR